MSVETPDETYWRLVRVKAEEYKADGCPGVTEIRRDACLEHDLHVGTLESDGVVALGGRASVALRRPHVEPLQEGGTLWGSNAG